MRRILAAFLFMLLLPFGARAETPIALFKSFAGNVNFTGTQKTVRTASNAVNACSLTSVNTDVQATLSGIPAGATVLSAQLYWAGSGSKGDYVVVMDGANVNAPSNRRYNSYANNLYYFGGSADVTSAVAAKGNGVYKFHGLTVDSRASYCNVEGVLGGFALMVVYSHPNETFRVLNMYEGFQHIQNSGVSLTLSNFKVPSPLGSATGRVGHVTWEGDETLGNTNAEDLFFNSVQMTDAMNPAHNQFNSSSNLNGDPASYGIDVDAYTVGYPTIQAGQTSATTLYQSGQDLVLLHSEIIAVPNVPVADLSITKTVRDATMTLGQSNVYTLTVTNNGPDKELGPVVVSDNVPAELSINSAAGTGWNCTVSGQLVTCTYPSTVAAGVTLAPVSLSVTPLSVPASGDFVNSASVTGQSFDNNAANSASSVTAGAGSSGYVFTNAACADGVAFGAAGQPCAVLNFGPRTAGTPIAPIYITSLNPATGVPTRLHKSQDVTRNFYFGVSCIDPLSANGVAPVFTAQAGMGVCASNGAKPIGSYSAAITFPAGSPSSAAGYSFTYADVGKVELYMTDSTKASGSSGLIVFRPARIAITSVTRNSDGFANPAPAVASGAKFVRAGELFSMTISALASTGAATPNFGRETTPESFTISVDGAIDPATGAVFADMTNIPALSGSFGAIANGRSSGNAFAWSEVGILAMKPGVASKNYLGTGDVTDTPVNVGRFYPDHFNTATNGPLDCVTNMNCPAGIDATYSGQPFEVTVTAQNAANTGTANYNGAFARDITLSAWGAAGASTGQNPPAASAGTLVNNGVPASAFADGVATVASPAYVLPNPFSSASPRALNWVAPTTIYLRAQESADPSVSSLRASGTIEDGVHVVSGRLLVANVYGSELLNLPVPLRAQYWSGGAGGRWENTTTDAVSVVTPTGANLGFANCTGALAASCSLTPLTSAPFTLAGGAGVLRLLPPGAGKKGSAELKVNSPAWLPSTIGKLVFGIYKSPVTYLRERY